MHIWETFAVATPIFFILVALIYFFMCCKIFKRPRAENENETGKTFLLDDITNPTETPQKVVSNPRHKYVESAATPAAQSNPQADQANPQPTVPVGKVEPKSSPNGQNMVRQNSIDPAVPGPSGLNNCKFIVSIFYQFFKLYL